MKKSLVSFISILLGSMTGSLFYFLKPRLCFTLADSGLCYFFLTGLLAHPFIVSISIGIIICLLWFIINPLLSTRDKIVNSIVFMTLYIVFCWISVIASWSFSGGTM